MQPVLHKETIQPNVVHTTVPIHETHHNPAQHHSTTALPPVSMDEYKNQGGALGGRQERFDVFEGEPKTIHGSVSTMHNKKDHGVKNPPEGVFHGDFDPLDGGKGHHTSGGPLGNKQHATGVNPALSSQSSVQREHRDIERGGNAAHANRGSGEMTKESPSLLDKLNPMTDSTGDGKAGFMK